MSLIVVLSHDECGAVAAATGIVGDAQVPPGYLRDIAERIAPNVLRARRAGAVTPAEVSGQHARYTIELLRQRSPIVDTAIGGGTVAAVSAQYCLASGAVAEIRSPGMTIETGDADPRMAGATLAGV